MKLVHGTHLDSKFAYLRAESARRGGGGGGGRGGAGARAAGVHEAVHHGAVVQAARAQRGRLVRQHAPAEYEPHVALGAQLRREMSPAIVTYL